MSAPITYLISERPPEFPCWVFASVGCGDPYFFWWSCPDLKFWGETRNACSTDTHYCHSESRPVHDPRELAGKRAGNDSDSTEHVAAAEDTKLLDWLDARKADVDQEGPGVIVYTKEDGLGYGASNGAWPDVRSAIRAAMKRDARK